MKLLHRCLLAVLVTLWVAMPGIGGEGEGGENGGGSGVWILPGASSVGVPSVAAGQTFQVASFRADCKLQLASQCGSAVATLIEPGSGQPLALPVSGRTVTISAAVFAHLAQCNVSQADILVADAAQCGYQIHMSIDAVASTAILTVQ